MIVLVENENNSVAFFSLLVSPKLRAQFFFFYVFGITMNRRSLFFFLVFGIDKAQRSIFIYGFWQHHRLEICSVTQQNMVGKKRL